MPHTSLRFARTPQTAVCVILVTALAALAIAEHPAWTTDLVNGDHFVGSSSTPAAVAGYPSVTVPAGSAFGLPAGISFIGRAWRDDLVLKLAYAYEQATRHRRPPRFPRDRTGCRGRAVGPGLPPPLKLRRTAVAFGEGG